MTREEKNQFIDSLSERLNGTPHFYIADTADLTVENNNKLRSLCFEKNVQLQVVKNTLLKKAMENAETDYSELYDFLKGPTSIMFTEIGKAPAEVIKEFRKKNNKPVLKAAFVEESIYIGDDQVKTLADLKSKEELIGDVIMLLQSPAKNVVSALTSASGLLAGLVKALPGTADTAEAKTEEAPKEEAKEEEITPEADAGEEPAAEATSEEPQAEAPAEEAPEEEAAPEVEAKAEGEGEDQESSDEKEDEGSSEEENKEE